LDNISLAEKLRLPLIVHCRDAWAKTFEILKGRKLTRVIFHSWTGDWEAAHFAVELGYFISFSGIVTFKNAPKVAESASKIPFHRILLETDSPFLSPEPYRGLGNEPKNVKIIAEFIAKLRNLHVDDIARITSKNAERVFGI
jgi:TatD DNase family protein